MISGTQPVVSRSERLHLSAAADVDRPPVPPLRGAELLVEQLDEVLHVEQVAHLLAVPPKPM